MTLCEGQPYTAYMDKQLIANRRAEVKQEIEKLKGEMDALTAELTRLDIAEEVFDSLTNAKPSKPEAISSSKESPEERPSVRSMIKEALMDAQQRGEPGLAPRHIREYIKTTYQYEIGQQVNTVASRMWHVMKELEKDESTGLFSLPSKDKPASQVSLEDELADLDIKPEAQGREAGPGGAK